MKKALFEKRSIFRADMCLGELKNTFLKEVLRSLFTPRTCVVEFFNKLFFEPYAEQNPSFNCDQGSLREKSILVQILATSRHLLMRTCQSKIVSAHLD